MSLCFAAALPVTAFALFIGPAEAGPCENDIYQANLALGKRLNAAAAAGKTAPESTFARLHRQPTPGTVADAEALLGDLPPAAVTAATEDLEKARKANSEGDLAACRAALADMDRQLER